MNRKQAFTLIELLIALALSSFVMAGMMLAYRNVMKKLDSSRELLMVNRKVGLLFNQLERDLSTAFIPVQLAQEKTKQEKNGDKTPQPQEAESKESTSSEKGENDKKIEKKKEQLKSFFIGTIQEGMAEKIAKEKLELFKDVSFVCANPLQIYGQKKPRIVRVKYQLVRDKEKTRQHNKVTYNLVRKETTDLTNVEFKEKEELELLFL